MITQPGQNSARTAWLCCSMWCQLRWLLHSCGNLTEPELPRWLHSCVWYLSRGGGEDWGWLALSSRAAQGSKRVKMEAPPLQDSHFFFWPAVDFLVMYMVSELALSSDEPFIISLKNDLWCLIYSLKNKYDSTCSTEEAKQGPALEGLTLHAGENK